MRSKKIKFVGVGEPQGQGFAPYWCAILGSLLYIPSSGKIVSLNRRPGGPCCLWGYSFLVDALQCGLALQLRQCQTKKLVV
jgi:hypothetical protein